MHHNGMTDQPYGPTPQQKKQLVDLLVAAELHQYLSSLNSQLNVNTVRQLKAVSDDDLVTVLGMSKPEVRRLRKFIKKMAGQSGTLEKIKNILTKSTHETSELCCLPVTDKSPTSFLIDQSDITISKELGRGTFGSVHSGTWITSSGSKLPIAARKMALFMSEQTRDGFLSSAQSLHLLKHNNIVRLFGVSMTTSHLFVVMEQAPGGQSLRSWLQLPRPSSAPPIHPLQLVEFSRQICSALTCLESCKFVHGDVSAGNVLVFSEDLVKVTDPGLRAALDPESQSLKSLVEEESEKLAWFAPECLESLHFSTFSNSSDVWSFGVTMWEVFSYGAMPSWNACGSAQLLSAMKSGKTLERPRTCPKDFYSVMADCWTPNPHHRPTFQQLSGRLGKLNLVRLQVETEPAKATMMTTTSGGREDQLVVKTGDIITVIDSSSAGSPVAGWWKGLNESTNQVGFFNPVNMKLLSGSEASKQPVAKQQTGSSGVLRRGKIGQQKPKLTAGMISLPLNDLRHTSHVGRDGETFGCDMLPIHQAATPVSDQLNSESIRSERSSALSSTISISPMTTATPQESELRKKRDPPARQNSKPPSSIGSDKMLNGTYRTKDSSPTFGSSKERSSIPLTSKLSVGSNLSGDILTRVKYSPSSISMVSADLSHITSLVSSDTLTDVSSLPGDIGSLSKSDYEDYECMDGENDDTFDVTATDLEDHPHDDTIVCGTDDDREEEDEDAEAEDDSPQTIEEPRTPKILETSSSLFDEVMFALGGAQQPSKRMQNGHNKSKKKAIFALGDSEISCEAAENSGDRHMKPSKTTREETKTFNTPRPSSKPDSDDTGILESTATRAEPSDDRKDGSMFRPVNGRQHQTHVNVCDSSFTNSSTISLMSSCSDLKSSNSSLASDAATAQGRMSVLSKISNALGRSRSKDAQRRFSQASTASRLSVALTNISGTTGEQDASNSKLSSSSFSGFDGKKTKIIALDSLPLHQDKYPSFLPSKSRSLKSSKAKDKLRRSSLILASVFQAKRDDKHRRPVLPTANFNTNELFFNKLREQEQEIAEQAEEDSRRLREEEGESEDSGVALHFLNQSQEAEVENTDDKYVNSSPNDPSRHEIKKDSSESNEYGFNNSNNEQNNCLKETSSYSSDILSKLNLNSSKIQERQTNFKLGIQNGRSLKDLTFTSQNGRKFNGIPESVGHEPPLDYCSKTLPKRAPRDADRRQDSSQNDTYKFRLQFESPGRIEEYEEPRRAKGDPFSLEGGKPTLIRTCSSGSDSPDVVDV